MSSYSRMRQMPSTFVQEERHCSHRTSEKNSRSKSPIVVSKSSWIYYGQIQRHTSPGFRPSTGTISSPWMSFEPSAKSSLSGSLRTGLCIDCKHASTFNEPRAACGHQSCAEFEHSTQSETPRQLKSPKRGGRHGGSSSRRLPKSPLQGRRCHRMCHSQRQCTRAERPVPTHFPARMRIAEPQLRQPLRAPAVGLLVVWDGSAPWEPVPLNHCESAVYPSCGYVASGEGVNRNIRPKRRLTETLTVAIVVFPVHSSNPLRDKSMGYSSLVAPPTDTQTLPPK